jgi:hypothetical protein
MYYKVKIKKLPEARYGRNVKTGQQMDGALAIQPTAMGGADIDQYIGEKPLRPNNVVERVPRDEANLEAEGGETVYGDINGDGMAEHAKITGPRHSEGGVPLNLPDDTFIFSDTKAMKLNDPDMLASFGKSTGSYTPAQLAKQYDINKYRTILQDPNSDTIDKKTAEIMIRNYNMKLGKLALAQESKKGFPQGIPMISEPYLEANGVSQEQIMPTYQPQAQQQAEGMPQPGMEQGAPQMPQDMPQQMPSGEPIAMSPEMMEQAPMAQYGMSMGGYDMPFAQYGMAMGANPQNYYGRQRSIPGSGPMFPDKGYTRKFDKGGDTTPEISADEQKIIDEKWNGKTDAYLAYKKAEKAIKENKDFRAKIYKNYKDVIDNPVNYTRSKSNWYDALKDRSEAEVIDALLAQEERNARLDAFGLDAKGTTQISVKGKNTNKEALDLIEKTPGLADLKGDAFAKGYLGQAAYIAYDDAVDPSKKGLSIEQRGLDDELKGRAGTISGIDNASTNTTLGQRLSYLPEEPAPEPLGPCEACPDGSIPERSADGTCECTERPGLETIPEPEAPTVTTAGWTAPDIVNYAGTFGDLMSVSKQYPWAAPVNLTPPKPVYYDPTREIAAQTEAQGQQAQALAQFMGPQAASARSSALQGTLAGSVADTLGRYNDLNVSAAQNYENQLANLASEESRLRAAQAQDVYDKSVMTRQNYENAVRQGKQNMRDAFATGWKNASDIAMLNATQEQYDIDPRTGTIVFQGGKAIQPDKSATFNSLLDDYISRGFDPKDAISAASKAMGDNSIDLSAAQKGGMYVMGANVFPFMFY